jgi:hypothetical protein
LPKGFSGSIARAEISFRTAKCEKFRAGARSRIGSVPWKKIGALIQDRKYKTFAATRVPWN